MLFVNPNFMKMFEPAIEVCAVAIRNDVRNLTKCIDVSRGLKQVSVFTKHVYWMSRRLAPFMNCNDWPNT